MQQGDIILVPFPFTDLTSIKTRPALIISKEPKEDVIVLAISSKMGGKNITLDNKDLEKGKLPVVSCVRYDKAVTLHQSLVRKIVGRVKSNITQRIIKEFTSLFS